MPPLPFFHPALQGLRALLCGFAQIFLQQHPGCGALVLLAILLGAPELLPGALLGGLASMWVAQRRGYPQADIAIGLYGYNGILLGLLLGLKLAWSPLLALLIVASAGLSSLLLAPWMRRMREHGWLPAFTIPFVLLGLALLTLVAPPVLPAATAPAPAGLEWPLAVLRGLAQVVFVDAPLAGLVLLLALLLADRRAALWALLGSGAGLALAQLPGWPGDGALVGLNGYNAVLAAITLAQVSRGPLAPLAALLLATALQAGFALLGLSLLTLPFILASWLVLAAARRLRRRAEQRPLQRNAS
ncbi:urea transporter [Pseudomonas sp. SP16.1]|uniref:urea transporter n=1 Tax=Pseudomonas sp. SP16.1 TaxID=3458854 RepID=UPI0040461E09